MPKGSVNLARIALIQNICNSVVGLDIDKTFSEFELKDTLSDGLSTEIDAVLANLNKEELRSLFSAVEHDSLSAHFISQYPDQLKSIIERLVDKMLDGNLTPTEGSPPWQLLQLLLLEMQNRQEDISFLLGTIRGSFQESTLFSHLDGSTEVIQAPSLPVPEIKNVPYKTTGAPPPIGSPIPASGSGQGSAAGSRQG